MVRRSFAVVLGFALSLSFSLISVTAQQSEPPKGSSSPANPNQQNKPSNPQTQEPNNKPSNAPTGPVTIQGTITAIQEPSAEEKKRQSEEESKSVWSKAFAPEQWANLALTCIGLIGVIIAIGTLKKMERQTKATELAAEAASNSSNVARDTLHMTERAYLEAVDWQQEVVAANVPLKVRFGIRNNGRTPAILLESNITRKSNGLVAPEKSEVGEKINPHGQYRMGPGVTFWQNVIDLPNLTEEESEGIKVGNHGLWYFGYVKYRDIFPTTPVHTVYFCVAYDISTGVLMIDKNGYHYAD